MKHATSAALGTILQLLDQIRTREGLKEKKLGVFYWKSKSLLHFHEDPAGMFADLNIGSQFQRFSANSPPEWKILLAAIDRAINAYTIGPSL
jgi:hypothetical protein